MRSLAIAPLVLLAGCGPASPPTPAASPTMSATSAAARVAALPAQQRVGVMLRAIRDAGQDCQSVDDVTRLADAGIRPTWLATCDGRQRWVVAIADDGTATVTAANDIARRR